MSIPEDSYRARGLRRQLVKEIERKGISDPEVLKAFDNVPRHFFFDPIFLEHAYEDKAFPIGEGQTISQPYTVAFQTQLLEIEKGKKILEIGTGSGYQAAILCELGAEVYSIEYQEKLYKKTKKFLPKIGYRPHLFWGDGSMGLTEHAPYDGIIVTAGAPNAPQPLLAQLKTGGILVVPIGDRNTQKMVRFQKVEKNKIRKKVYSNFAFVPLLGKEGWNKNG
jgi:protein-L-isoaspartate(D-aspartate) O-methyltransferase